MAPNPRRLDERLDALYATLPALACSGVCSDSCGPIELSVRERARAEAAAGKALTCGATGASCSMLTADRRCGVYDVRPMICRLWGIIESLPCPYGCVPEGGHLTDADGWRLLLEADRIGGKPNREEFLRLMDAIKAFEALGADEQLRVARGFSRAKVPRPTLAGRAPALPRSILELDRG